MKLNLGCGHDIRPGWENIDSRNYGQVEWPCQMDGSPCTCAPYAAGSDGFRFDTPGCECSGVVYHQHQDPGCPLHGLIDFACRPLPYEDASCELVLANHSLHMVEWGHMAFVLAEIHRVLQPNGPLRIIEADIVKAFRAWEDGDADWFPIDDSVAPNIDAKYSLWLTWYGTRATLWIEGLAVQLLEEAGFEHITLVPYLEREGPDRAGESLVIEARRP